MFSKVRDDKKQEVEAFWKEDFSNCSTLKYLPDYSVCRCPDNRRCRYASVYSGLTLCGHPDHKKFIPEGSEAFDPQKGIF
jgi:hypothetical protein